VLVLTKWLDSVGAQMKPAKEDELEPPAYDHSMAKEDARNAWQAGVPAEGKDL
jgi:hypothetical protein